MCLILVGIDVTNRLNIHRLLPLYIFSYAYEKYCVGFLLMFPTLHKNNLIFENSSFLFQSIFALDES